MPWPPAAVTSSAVSSIVSGRSISERRSRVLRPVAYTVAPASPRATAMPRPPPRVAPLTSATLPASGLSRPSSSHRSFADRSSISQWRTHAGGGGGHSGLTWPRGPRVQRQHGGDNETAAGNLYHPERLPEDEEGEQHRHEWLDRGEDRGGGRPHPLEAGEEEANRGDGRDYGKAGKPTPAGHRQVAWTQLAEQRRADRQRRGRAGADECREHLRPHAPDDAVADQDVGAVDDRGPEPERGAERIERAGPGAGHNEREPAGGQDQGSQSPPVEPLAAEGHGGRGDDRRERVEQQR